MAAAVKDHLRDAQLHAEKLAYVVRSFLALVPEAPCRVCRENETECPLCRVSKAARAALSDFEKKGR